MGATIRTVDYYYTTVFDRPGEGCKLLAKLAAAEVNLLAFTAIPIGSERTQLVLFPENVDMLIRAAEESVFTLVGPQKAFLVQGDDQLGALIDIHRTLYDASINVYSSSGVSDGRGGYGYIIHVKPEDFEEASRALGL
jgi:hypothetical protein